MASVTLTVDGVSASGAVADDGSVDLSALLRELASKRKTQNGDIELDANGDVAPSGIDWRSLIKREDR